MLSSQAASDRQEDQQKFTQTVVPAGTAATIKATADRQENQQGFTAEEREKDRAAAAANNAAKAQEKRRAEAQKKLDALRSYWDRKPKPDAATFAKIVEEKRRLMADGAR